MSEPTDTPEDGDFPATPVALVVVAALAVVWLFAVAAGCATGAGPPPQAPPVQAPPVERVKAISVETPARTPSETPAAGAQRGAVFSGDAPPPVILLGWTRWDGLGNSWFEPAGRPQGVPLTMPAAGVPAPRPFAQAPTFTPDTTARGAGHLSTTSPAGIGTELTHTLAGGAGLRGDTNRGDPNCGFLG